jgi:hypothetical protein
VKGSKPKTIRIGGKWKLDEEAYPQLSDMLRKSTADAKELARPESEFLRAVVQVAEGLSIAENERDYWNMARERICCLIRQFVIGAGQEIGFVIQAMKDLVRMLHRVLDIKLPYHPGQLSVTVA